MLGDIATPHSNLTDTTYIENRSPNSGEIAFYDENDPWDVVVYICGRNDSAEPIDISPIDRGAVDFYVMGTR